MRLPTRAVPVAIMLFVVASSLSVGAARTVGPASDSTTVLAIEQSPSTVYAQSSMTISLEVSDASQIRQVYFTFCEISPGSFCFFPRTMTLTPGTTWYNGTTLPMANYTYMGIGARAGVNITLQFLDGTNMTEPRLPNTFTSLTVAQLPVTRENVFAMVVSDHTYGLSGRVVDASTGASIGGATVTVTPGGATTTSATGSGDYSFPGLANGTYTVSASKGGFRTADVTVAIAGGATVRDLDLSNGSVSNPPGGVSKPAPSASPLTSPIILGGILALAVGVVALAFLGFRRRSRGKPSASPTEPRVGPP